MIYYALRKDFLINEYSGFYISARRDRLEYLVCLCNRYNLKITHLNDIIEDFMSC